MERLARLAARQIVGPLAFLGLSALVPVAAIAATATWEFNLPADSAFDPPYPSVASLTMTDIAGGVRVTLDPNEASPGYPDDLLQSFIERLTIIYNPGATDPVPITFSNAAGSTAPLQDLEYVPPPAGPSALDSSYFAAPYGVLAFDWCSGNGNNKVCTLSAAESSTFDLFGTGLDVADFLAPAEGITNSNMPNNIFGVISVTAYSLPNDFHTTPSNWVAQQLPAIPEPGTYALMLAGLGAVGMIVRRRRSER
ncbi:MAG TPA: PEP-CTERM sorting domain-containing protein [Methylibium sp.]|nr:PEP-CTERM sorting domain-containing protein [Methylibium sp.]